MKKTNNRPLTGASKLYVSQGEGVQHEKNQLLITKNQAK